MQGFKVEGFTGLFLVLAAVLLALFLVAVVPTLVLTALWNALVASTFNGPEIGLLQGALLWSIVALLLYAWHQPEIAIEMRKEGTLPANWPDGSASKPLKRPKPLSSNKKGSDKQQWSEHWEKWRKQFGNEEK
jgi:hypothetical protein